MAGKLFRLSLSHKALAKVFRAKLLEVIVAQKMRAPKDCPKQWVVDCKNVGNGDKALMYLGKYLYRGVIQEKDILKCENGMVTFRYLHSKTKQYQTKIVTGEYFLYLLMLHILPKVFAEPGITVFSIHAVKNSSKYCSWFCVLNLSGWFNK